LPHSNPSSMIPNGFYKPPRPPRKVGAPGQRTDGGGRTECSNGMTALVPIYEPKTSGLVYGVTTIERPTFWFYLPAATAATGIFQLQDANKKMVYDTQISLPKTAGIFRLTLPDSAPPLEIGKPYRWYFKIVCTGGVDFVDGWIQREAVDRDLQRQLEQASAMERSRLYANHGIWFEALTTAADSRLTDPNSQEWAALLKAIDLEELAAKPIVDCCEAIAR